MTKFNGFTNTETFTPTPDAFFHQLLKEIDDVEELKVTLYAIWRVMHTEGPYHALRQADFEPAALGLPAEAIGLGLEKAAQRGSLLRSEHESQVFYFLNSPRGRVAAQAFARGEPVPLISAPPVERPNIFRLYEENIGPLTPLVADFLKDAEQAYPPDWIAEAIDLAVRHNKRNWKYAHAILKRWKEEGRAEKQDRRDDQASRQRDVEDKIKKFVGG
jgi:DnaD/phage-associated family protein